MKLILLWAATELVSLIVVGEAWVSKGGYANDKWTGLFFLTGATALVGAPASLGIALLLRSAGQ